MTVEIYNYIFIGGAVLAAIMLVITVFLFVYLNIPTVIGDLTGSNARRAIEQIRNQNESSGEKTYRSSRVNRERGKITDKISASGRLIRNQTSSLHGAMATEKIHTHRLTQAENQTTLLEENQGSQQTTLLDQQGGQQTTLLNQQGGQETVLLEQQGGQETTLLGQQGGQETTLLAAESNNFNHVIAPNVSDCSREFIVEYEITYIHTNEVIV